MPKLSLEQRARIIGQLEAGVSAKEITCIFNVHKTSVYRLKEKFDRDGTVKRRKGMTRQVYADTILENNLIPFVRDNPNVIFQQDNAPPHSAGVTAQYLTDQDITVLEWAAVSPDMNCVENVWALLSRAIRKHRPQPQTHDELFNILSAEWERIPAAVVYSHTSSMYRRVNALWRVDGGFTKY